MNSGYRYVPAAAPAVELGVRGVLAVAHSKPGGAVHGHTYQITAWFDCGELDDLKAKLDQQLALLDHGVLSPEYARAEDLGLFIMTRLHGCFAIQVDRPLEGLFCNVLPSRRSPSA